MKKIIGLILISFGINAQTIPFKQIQKSTGTGSTVVTNTAGILTYTDVLSSSMIPTLSTYVPYTGANQSFTTGNYNGYANNFASRATNIVSANATTSMTVLSTRLQQLTGVNSHTFNLPNATTLFIGFTFEFNNNSSGVLYINDNGGNFIISISSGGYARMLTIAVSTSNGSWDSHLLVPSNARFGTGGLILPGSVTSPTIYGGSTAGSALNLMSSSSATPGVVSVGSSSLSSFIAQGTATFSGQTKQTNTLNIEGNTTWITPNTSSITIGTVSGTAAVLSDAIFNVTCRSFSFNPADGASYFWGNSGAQPFTSSNGTVTIPSNCTLIGYDFSAVCTAGSAENATLTISINNGSGAYNLTTALTFSTASGYQTSTASGLSQDFNANDKICMKMFCPSWATNPLNVYMGVTLWFRRRQ